MMTTTPAATPKRGGSRILYIIIGLIVACLVCIGVVYLVVGPSILKVVNTLAGPLVSTQTFFDDVVKGDYNGAYAQVHPSAQSSFGGSADGLKQALTTNGLIPTTFAVNNVQVGTNTAGESLAIVNGTGSFGGTTKYAYVQLKQDAGNWKITNIDVSTTAPTVTPVATP